MKTLTDRFSLDARDQAIQEALRAGWPAVYGYKIRSTEWLRGTEVSSVDVCRTAEEAQSRCIRFALRSGWTYPRWWQWWRWNDTRPPKKLVDEIATTFTGAGELG